MTEKRLWIYRYACGCWDGPLPRSELFLYCVIHGKDVVEKTKMATKKELEFIEKVFRPEKIEHE